MLNFVPISLRHAKNYGRLYGKSQNKSFDSTFFNMWINRNDYKYELAFDDNLCWVRYYDQGQVYYRLPVGDLKNCDWDKIISEDFPEQAEIKSVLAPTALKIHLACRNKIKLREEPGAAEYIYDVDKQINLPGMRYHVRRQHVRFFLENYEYRYAPLSMENIKEVMACHEKLIQKKHQEKYEEKQNAILSEIFSNWKTMQNIVKGNVLLLEDKIIGYVIGEAVDKENVFMYFSKASTDWKGASQTNELLFLEQYHHCKYLNTGEDKGLPGLRRLKQEYGPEVLLTKKYHIRKSA